MDKQKIIDLLNDQPVIAAVKDSAGLEKSLASNVNVVFVLYGSIVNLKEIVKALHQAGKAAIVHIDLIEGLSSEDVSVDFVARDTLADGIISTRTSLLKRARENGIVGIRRFFLLDSMALENLHRQLAAGSVDFVEILPGIMPEMIQSISAKYQTPLIAGGLILKKSDIQQALSAGAAAVSTTCAELWNL